MSDSGDSKRDGFTFIWKIENFSLLAKLIKDEDISSPVFTTDNLDKIRWRLQLLPVGYSEENKDTFLFKICKEPATTISFIHLYYELSILSNSGTKAKSVTVSRIEIDDISLKGGPLCITPREIFRKREILPEDTLIVQCKIGYSDKLCLKPGFSLARTRIGAEQRSFSWTLDKFSTLQINDQKSVSVELGSKLKLSFKITLYLTGIPTDEEKIRIKVEGRNEETFDILIVLGISMLDINGEAVCHSEDEFQLSEGKEEWRFPLVIDKKQLVSNKDLLLPNDVLTLKCLMTVSKGDIVLNEIECTTYGPYTALDIKAALSDRVDLPCIGSEAHLSWNSLTNDMRHLFKEKRRTDVSLRVQNETFPVHKTILTARSAVFETMFDTDMKEKNTSTVEINDFEPDTIRRLLLYIYSDAFEDIQWENASSLYLAAEKYAILGLKERCSSFLKMNLSKTNVCDILVLADIMKDEELKNCILSFIQDNDTVIMNSLGWKEFVQKHPELAVEILTRLYKNGKFGCCQCCRRNKY